MRTKNLLMMAAVAVAMTLGSCSNNDEVEVVDVSNTPINFITSINQAQTRAGHAAGTLTGGSFGLFVTTEATTDTRFNTSNRNMTYTDGAWSAPANAAQLLWKDNSTNVNYIAYMPYNEAAYTNNTINTAYPLSTTETQTEETINAEDFLYVIGTTTGSASANGIALAFNHKLSQFKITLTKGTELAEGVTISSVKLDACCNLATTINLTDGTVATTPTDTQNSTISLLKNSETEFECILVPQTFTNKLKVVITDSNSKTYMYISNETLTFTSGKTYTLPLTVGRDKVTAGSFTAAPWGTPVNGGSLETE